eukprot:scaffold18063_cov54-Phaeocystis_antarctica.AAC.2
MASLLPKGIDRPQPQRRPSFPSRTASGATTSTDAVLRRRRRMSRRRPPPRHRLISTAHVDTLPTKITRRGNRCQAATPHAPGIITPGNSEHPAIIWNTRARSGSRSSSRNLHYDGRGGGFVGEAL